MLRYSREDLLKNETQVKKHDEVVKKPYTEQVFMLALTTLQMPLPSHPAADILNHAALSDSYNRGVRDTIEFFMKFTDQGYSGPDSDFIPLEQPK